MTRHPVHLVPTPAHVRELFHLGVWVNPPTVEALIEERRQQAMVNALLRNDIRTLDELFPVYLAIRGRIANGLMPETAWSRRSTWLPVPLDGIGAPRAEKIVRSYGSWAEENPRLAEAIEVNHLSRADVPARTKLMVRSFIVDQHTLDQIAAHHQVTTELVRQLLAQVGLDRDVQQLFHTNIAWMDHWNNVPCHDEDLGQCEGQHELNWGTWWLKPGELIIRCRRHAEAHAEAADIGW